MDKVTGHLRLIGSEESAWLGIPAFKDIKEHLQVKLQNLEGSIQPPDDTWELIQLLATTPAAVANLMRYYYEPTDEDRLLKRKLPSTFHFNLARSVADSFGQIIVTTNRDRLIEWGLVKFGITPQILKPGTALTKIAPVAQTKCTLIKLNGDYLDLEPPPDDCQFRLFLQREIQQVYLPVKLKCSYSDLQQLREFNF